MRPDRVILEAANTDFQFPSLVEAGNLRWTHEAGLGFETVLASGRPIWATFVPTESWLRPCSAFLIEIDGAALPGRFENTRRLPDPEARAAFEALCRALADLGRAHLRGR